MYSGHPDTITPPDGSNTRRLSKALTTNYSNLTRNKQTHALPVPDPASRCVSGSGVGLRGREVEKSGIVTVAGRGEEGRKGDAAVLGCALDGGKPGEWRERCTNERTARCEHKGGRRRYCTVLYC